VTIGGRSPSVSDPRWFCRDDAEWTALVERLKLTPCPHCRAVGTLIRHGVLTGFDDSSPRRTVRARRIFCSNRHRRRAPCLQRSSNLRGACRARVFQRLRCEAVEEVELASMRTVTKSLYFVSRSAAFPQHCSNLALAPLSTGGSKSIHAKTQPTGQLPPRVSARLFPVSRPASTNQPVPIREPAGYKNHVIAATPRKPRRIAPCDC
jgi:hypothetical protein